MRVEFGDWREGIFDVAKVMLETETALSTTIVNNKMIFEQGRDFDAVMARNETRYAPPLLQVFWASPFNPYRGEGEPQGPRESKQVKALLDMTAALHDQGVTILAGTDAPNPTTVPGAALHEELMLLVGAGLSSAEALETATANAADHIQFASPRGRVATGLAADLILTATNPLDDITALSRFNALVRSGAYAPADVVLAEREALAKAYEQDKEVLSLFDPGSADAIVAALIAAPDQPAIHREALTSLIWAYWKFGNLPAAKELAALQQELFPDDLDALYVVNVMSGQ